MAHAAMGAAGLATQATLPPTPQAFFERIRSDLDANRFALPSLPSVARRIREAMDDPNVSAEKVGQIVNADPAITAKIVRAANNPVYRGYAKCEGTRAAIVRLGLKTVRQLVTSISLLSLFKSRHPELATRMRELWEHSVDVGAICMVLARRLSGLDQDEALLAGLLHDIGMVAVLTYAERYPALTADLRQLEKLARVVRGPLGLMILAKWNFTPGIREAARHAEHWRRESDGALDYCDLVQLAQLHHYAGAPRGAALPRLPELPAFKKLPLAELTPASSLQVLVDAHKQIEEIRSLFMD